MKKRILSILLALCMLFCLVPTTAFAADCAENLVDPVIWIHLSSDGGGYYDVLNGTWTAADFFQPGKAPKGAKITAVTPPTSPSIPVSVNVNSDGTLNCTKTENTTEPVPKSETYTVTITSDDYAPISAPLTVRQYLNAGFRGPVYFDDELLYGDTYTYTCRVNNPGENGVWSALIQDPQMFEIYKETTDTTSEPGKSIYTVHIRAIKAGARITCIDFLYVSDTTMASSKVSRGAVTGGAVRTRPLTVTAGSATITEGNALPTDLVSCTGLLNSEGRKDDRDTVLDNALGYQLLDANNEEVTAATARNMPGTYTVVPAATLKSGWGERYSLNKVNGTLTVENQPDEQFTLAPGGRYYFDLSAMNIPGTANGGNSDGAVSLPDTSLHYVPFTYVGTIEAYKLTSATATTEEYAQQNKYPHSLFVADYAVTHTISWGGLNDEGLIFGKNYASGGVDYTLRAPSVGSNSTGSGESQHDTPSNNEWDRILDKNSGYIQNWNKMYSWGQDTSSAAESFRAYRGYNSARFWYYTSSSFRNVYLGFRPVLEVLNPGTLGSDGLKVVTLDLGGGELGNSSEDIQIIVKTGSEFTAPASDGLTRPDGNTGSYFMWLGSDGKLYAPGAIVPAEVTNLTAQFALSEQFSLKPGGRYYFDLSGAKIPGTANGSLPDTKLHYVPFTYAGTIEAYKLMSATATTEDYARKNKYAHSLFVADYTVTHTVSWDDLNTAGLIFGKDYAAGGVGYTLRAPSVGSDSTGWDDSQRGVPQSNEWDTMLNKDSGYIQNWNKMYLWGQDVSSDGASLRAVRGYHSARFWGYFPSSGQNVSLGFRPVLEVLNADTLGSDGLKVVTLDLGGGKLGGSSDAIHIIVKNGSKFTAPASGGLTRPAGDTGSYFMWLDSNGNSYVPGASVPADVTELTVQWTAPTYTVTLHTNGGTINNGNVTEYTYGVGAALPTDVTRTGYTFKGWYDNENLTGSPVTAIGGAETGNKEYWAKWEINQYTITFDTNGGSEIAPITQDYGTEITAPDNPTRKGYTFKGWDKEIPKTMPAENMTVKAQWEINQYTITFDTNGGSEIAPITQDYGTEITAPDNPTRKGYTFKGWDKEIPETMPAENITVKAQWEINQYTIAFDTNGGSEIAPITQDYGTEITAPDNPTRKGYTFKGWDKEIPETMPAENITVKAQWKINQYTITFDTNGGSEIAPITQDYGTEITAPDNPTRKGYTFKGWDKEIPETMPAENITVKAQWEINQYTIVFDTNGGSEIAPITQDYGTEITAPADPTRKGYTFKGWDKEIPETMPAENITITARWKDTEKPTGEIIIGTNKWNEFLNKLTFGIFFKDTQEVTINAVDNSGVVFVSYLVTDKELSEAELNSLVFRAYEEPFSIDPNGEYIVYVMLVDENINITYLRSDRITLDNIQPVISGIENGKTYCEAQTVTVNEKYVDTVTVNGTAVTLDADGGFVLPPTNGEQKIVVTDKAGNNAEMTVTVNNGHTFGEWVSDNDGKHTRKCTVDGCDAFETENCSGGNATCTEKAVCDVCCKAYGEFDGTNHKGGVQEWTTRTAFNHEQKWNCCGAVIVASEAHEWKDGVCRECGYVCLHNDADKDHICDYCKKTISEHVDKDKNHICDYCEKTISAHEDATPEEIKKPDTVTAKPDDSKSPQTGGNSNLVLWIALLIISGGVMKGVTAFGKNKKHSAKIKDK